MQTQARTCPGLQSSFARPETRRDTGPGTGDASRGRSGWRRRVPCKGSGRDRGGVRRGHRHVACCAGARATSSPCGRRRCDELALPMRAAASGPRQVGVPGKIARRAPCACRPPGAMTRCTTSEEHGLPSTMDRVWRKACNARCARVRPTIGRESAHGAQGTVAAHRSGWTGRSAASRSSFRAADGPRPRPDPGQPQAVALRAGHSALEICQGRAKIPVNA